MKKDLSSAGVVRALQFIDFGDVERTKFVVCLLMVRKRS